MTMWAASASFWFFTLCLRQSYSHALMLAHLLIVYVDAGTFKASRLTLSSANSLPSDVPQTIGFFLAGNLGGGKPFKDLDQDGEDFLSEKTDSRALCTKTCFALCGPLWSLATCVCSCLRPGLWSHGQ